MVCTTSLLASCNSSDDDCQGHVWSYSGSNGPDNWHVCHPECGGEKQSPINIANPVENPELLPLERNYEEVPIQVLNNGHTLKFDYPDGSFISVDGIEYQLIQFHFHTASEHTLNGMQYPMEIHLVHRRTETDLAVIGIVVEEGDENPFFESILEFLPEEEGELFKSSNTINADDLYPDSDSYYTYSGSLTTPTCDEVVKWYLMTEPITASTAQIEVFIDIMGLNYRPVQPINNRTIELFE